jgi:uncharacterized protein (UPF0212 family)
MAPKLDVNYVCPNCRSCLLVWNNIVLIIKSCTEDKQGVLLLNPELGNYEYICHDKLDFKGIESLDYFCPVCNSNLTATHVNRNQARIIMIDEDLKEYDLYLSKPSGEQSILKISNSEIQKRKR